MLPALEQLRWVRCYRNDQELVSVDAFIPPADDLIAEAGTMLNIVMATPVQRAALALLRATSLQPLEESSALQHAAEFGDEAASQALRHLVSIQLVRRTQSDDGRSWGLVPERLMLGQAKLVYCPFWPFENRAGPIR